MVSFKKCSPLLHPHWRYVEHVSIQDFSSMEWEVLNKQRAIFRRQEQVNQIVALLENGRDEATFGYMINNFRHCLQSATLAFRDGLDEETVVVALLHDVGFNICPASHGEFAAALLGPYVEDRHYWMLQRHSVFQDFHAKNLPGVNVNARDKWRFHPYFYWAEEFVAKYDQAACDPEYDEEPLETFIPMMRRVFSRTPVVRVQD